MVLLSVEGWELSITQQNKLQKGAQEQASTLIKRNLNGAVNKL